MARELLTERRRRVLLFRPLLACACRWILGRLLAIHAATISVSHGGPQNHPAGANRGFARQLSLFAYSRLGLFARSLTRSVSLPLFAPEHLETGAAGVTVFLAPHSFQMPTTVHAAVLSLLRRQANKLTGANQRRDWLAESRSYSGDFLASNVHDHRHAGIVGRMNDGYGLVNYFAVQFQFASGRSVRTLESADLRL